MAQSKFFHFFPMPSYLRMPSAGLSVSDDAIRFVRFIDKDGAPALDGYGEAPLFPGIVDNGAMAKPDDLAKSLASFRKEHGLEFVHMVVPDDKVYLFTIDMPAIPEADLRQALEYKIEENVPLSISEAVFDYAVVGRRPADGTMKVVVSAIAKPAAESYVSVLRSAGLEPLSLELESQAIANAAVPATEKGFVFLIDFDRNKTGIYVVESGIVQFSTVIPVDDAARAARDDGPDDGGKAEGRSAKYRRLPLVLEQMERISNYWENSEKGEGELGEFSVLACGEGALDGDLIERFSRLAKKEVEVPNVWQNAISLRDQVPQMPSAQSYKFAAAIGAAMLDHPHMNRHV